MAPLLQLPTDTTDDLIYFSRTGDLDSLTDLLTTLSQQHSTPLSAIIIAAIDTDADGLGSGSSLLHYPAANGNVEVVKYLLESLGVSSAPSSSPPPASSTTQPASSTAASSTPPTPSTAPSTTHLQFLNHRNVSGNTALHWAGMNGHLEIVKALVHAGADPGIANAAGRDVVVESEWSSREGAAECALWLLGACEGLERGVGLDEPEGEGAGRNGLEEDKAGEDGDVKVDATGDANGESHEGGVVNGDSGHV